MKFLQRLHSGPRHTHAVEIILDAAISHQDATSFDNLTVTIDAAGILPVPHWHNRFCARGRSFESSFRRFPTSPSTEVISDDTVSVHFPAQATANFCCQDKRGAAESDGFRFSSRLETMRRLLTAFSASFVTTLLQHTLHGFRMPAHLSNAHSHISSLTEAQAPPSPPAHLHKTHCCHGRDVHCLPLL